jgi:hypothetical protein
VRPRQSPRHLCISCGLAAVMTLDRKTCRAAAEAVSHRDLAEMFRMWLKRPGIPNEFRDRYSSPRGKRGGN